MENVMGNGIESIRIEADQKRVALEEITQRFKGIDIDTEYKMARISEACAVARNPLLIDMYELLATLDPSLQENGEASEAGLRELLLDMVNRKGNCISVNERLASGQRHPVASITLESMAQCGQRDVFREARYNPLYALARKSLEHRSEFSSLEEYDEKMGAIDAYRESKSYQVLRFLNIFHAGLALYRSQAELGRIFTGSDNSVRTAFQETESEHQIMSHFKLMEYIQSLLKRNALQGSPDVATRAERLLKRIENIRSGEYAPHVRDIAFFVPKIISSDERSHLTWQSSAEMLGASLDLLEEQLAIIENRGSEIIGARELLLEERREKTREHRKSLILPLLQDAYEAKTEKNSLEEKKRILTEVVNNAEGSAQELQAVFDTAIQTLENIEVPNILSGGKGKYKSLVSNAAGIALSGDSAGVIETASGMANASPPEARQSSLEAVSPEDLFSQYLKGRDIVMGISADALNENIEETRRTRDADRALRDSLRGECEDLSRELSKKQQKLRERLVILEEIRQPYQNTDEFFGNTKHPKKLLEDFLAGLKNRWGSVRI